MMSSATVTETLRKLHLGWTLRELHLGWSTYYPSGPVSSLQHAQTHNRHMHVIDTLLKASGDILWRA